MHGHSLVDQTGGSARRFLLYDDDPGTGHRPWQAKLCQAFCLSLNLHDQHTVFGRVDEQ